MRIDKFMVEALIIEKPGMSVLEISEQFETSETWIRALIKRVNIELFVKRVGNTFHYYEKSYALANNIPKVLYKRNGETFLPGEIKDPQKHVQERDIVNRVVNINQLWPAG